MLKLKIGSDEYKLMVAHVVGFESICPNIRLIESKASVLTSNFLGTGKVMQV